VAVRLLSLEKCPDLGPHYPRAAGGPEGEDQPATDDEKQAPSPPAAPVFTVYSKGRGFEPPAVRRTTLILSSAHIVIILVLSKNEIM